MPNILAIDTTSALCQVGLQTQEEVSFSVCQERRVHAQRLLPMVDELLAKAQLKLHELDLICVCTGPGSFTGIRIGVGVAQGLAMALNKPVLGISSLEALAYSGTRVSVYANECLFVAALIARTNEVYLGVYHSSNGELTLRGSEQVADVENLAEVYKSELATFGIGNGWQYAESLQKGLDGTLHVEKILDCNLDVAAIRDTLELCDKRFPDLDLPQLARQPVVPNYLKEHLVYSK